MRWKRSSTSSRNWDSARAVVSRSACLAFSARWSMRRTACSTALKDRDTFAGSASNARTRSYSVPNIGVVRHATQNSAATRLSAGGVCHTVWSRHGGHMCDQDHFEQDREEYEASGQVTRRQFGALLGAGMVMMLPKVVGAVADTESEVTIKTPDGTCDAYFVHPTTGTAPGVLVWPDIFGLRPAFRDMSKRLAETGYSVLVINPFYRTQKAPTAPKGAATPIPDLLPLAKGLSETTHMTDAKAFIAWMDQQQSVAKNRKIGTQGYCMGGPIAFRTAAAVPGRVGAVASFHGGGLVTKEPNSPHLQASKTKAQLLIAIASNDDMRSPDEKNVLKDTFAKSGQPAEIEVYSGAHGWCPPDSTVYNMPDAEKAWSRLLELYKKALA